MAWTERPRLLVVDDDPEITSSFKAILLSEGYEVMTAKDGREALERVRQVHFDQAQFASGDPLCGRGRGGDHRSFSAGRGGRPLEATGC
jgi:hypothetical protein